VSDDPIAGELKRAAVVVARAIRWGRVAWAAACVAVGAAAFALGFFYETKKHAEKTHKELEAATEKVGDAGKITSIRVDSIERKQDEIIVRIGTVQGQLWLLSDHFHVRKLPAPTMPAKE
jgi:hypothetical protein